LSSSSPDAAGSTTPPTITLNGNNPATITVGSSYEDLGAIVTDNQGHALGYKTFLNGTLVSNIVLDSSKVATDTVTVLVAKGPHLRELPVSGDGDDRTRQCANVDLRLVPGINLRQALR
jgi:hypothetical protein